MQDYICKVKKSDGTLLKKYMIKAEDFPDLFTRLKSNNLYLVDYRLKEERKDIVGGNKIKLSTKDIAVFCRQLASMLTSGVTLVKALNILYQQIEKKNSKESIKRLYESVQRGDQFSEAIRKQGDVYPEIMISMIEAGEASGQMDQVIEKLASQFENEVKLKAKIRTAMMYPIILASLSVAVVLVMVTQVLPLFLGMFEGVAVLPLPTRILLAFSNVITGYWYLLLVGIGMIVFGFRAYVSTDQGRRKWDGTKMRLPLVGGTITKISAVRFTRTLSTLLASGITLMKALEIVIKIVGNTIIADGLVVVKDDIRKGMPLSAALRKVNVLPPMVYSMIGIGEEAGTMESMLEKCADYYDDEVDNAIQKLVGLMEPLLIIFMAAVIGFIVVAMMLPIFDIYDAISA